MGFRLSGLDMQAASAECGGQPDPRDVFAVPRHRPLWEVVESIACKKPVRRCDSRRRARLQLRRTFRCVSRDSRFDLRREPELGYGRRGHGQEVVRARRGDAGRSSNSLHTAFARPEPAVDPTQGDAGDFGREAARRSRGRRRSGRNSQTSAKSSPPEVGRTTGRKSKRLAPRIRLISSSPPAAPVLRKRSSAVMRGWRTSSRGSDRRLQSAPATELPS